MAYSGYTFTVFKGSAGSIVKSKSHRGPLKRDEVLLKLTHSGVCGTDLHYNHADMVLGHEGVGIVQEVGPHVQDFKRGDRAGFGYLHGACGNCEHCLSGHEVYCDEAQNYGFVDTDIGSMATHCIWRAGYLFHVPDAMDSANAAPLMCGGATVFGVMEEYDIKPADVVGVVGSMGCDVVAFSGGETKRVDAMKMGATEFHSLSGKESLDLGGRKINHLIVTASAQPDWNLFIPVTAKRGGIYPLSVSLGNNLVIPYTPVVLNGLRIQGNAIASRETHRRMLEFAARTGIRPILQHYEFSEKGIEKAFEELENGEVRYRGVVDVDVNV